MCPQLLRQPAALDKRCRHVIRKAPCEYGANITHLAEQSLPTASNTDWCRLSNREGPESFVFAKFSMCIILILLSWGRSPVFLCVPLRWHNHLEAICFCVCLPDQGPGTVESSHVAGAQHLQERGGLGEVPRYCPGESAFLFPLRTWITAPPPGPGTDLIDTW